MAAKGTAPTSVGANAADAAGLSDAGASREDIQGLDEALRDTLAQEIQLPTGTEGDQDQPRRAKGKQPRGKARSQRSEIGGRKTEDRPENEVDPNEDEDEDEHEERSESATDSTAADDVDGTPEGEAEAEPEGEDHEPDPEGASADDGEGEGESEGDDADDPIAAWPKDAQKALRRMRKRIAKLTARLKGGAEDDDGEEGEEAEVRGQRSEVGEELAEDLGPGPVQMAVQLRQDIADREAWLDQLEAGGENGYTVRDPKTGQEVTYTPEQVRQARRKWSRELYSAQARLDQLAEWLQNRTREKTVEARQRFPFLRDKTSRDYQAVQTVLKQFPQLKEIPDHLSFIATVIASKKAEAAAKAKGKNGSHGTNANGNVQRSASIAPRSSADVRTANAAPARLPGRPGAMPPRARPEEAHRQARVKKFMETGRIEDAADSVLDFVDNLKI